MSVSYLPQTLLETLGLERGQSWGKMVSRQAAARLMLWTCLPQDGEFSFPLESVKKLKNLQEPRIRNNSQVEGPVDSTLCSHPKFPEELKPLCEKPNAQEILQRLGELPPL